MYWPPREAPLGISLESICRGLTWLWPGTGRLIAAAESNCYLTWARAANFRLRFSAHYRAPVRPLGGARGKINSVPSGATPNLKFAQPSGRPQASCSAARVKHAKSCVMDADDECACYFVGELSSAARMSMASAHRPMPNLGRPARRRQYVCWRACCKLKDYVNSCARQ